MKFVYFVSFVFGEKQDLYGNAEIYRAHEIENIIDLTDIASQVNKKFDYSNIVIQNFILLRVEDNDDMLLDPDVFEERKHVIANQNYGR